MRACEAGDSVRKSLRCHPFHGLTPLLNRSWGCARKASLHPRLNASACFAGSKNLVFPKLSLALQSWALLQKNGLRRLHHFWCNLRTFWIKLPPMPPYEPEAWRGQQPADNPSMREQCRLLDLLGRINYKILSGNRVYVEVDGVVYKTLYGGYWRSVFTGIEHYLLRCEQVSGNVWSEEYKAPVDLPIAYSDNGWTARGHSLSFILNRDPKQNPSTLIRRFRRLRKFMSSTAHVTTIA